MPRTTHHESINPSHDDIAFHKRVSAPQLRVAAMAVCALALSNCATFPEQTKIAKFGSAANTVGVAIEKAYVNHVQLVDALGEEDAAVAFIRRENFSFPPVAEESKVQPELWGVRIAAVKAVQDYASELAKISEPGASARIAVSAESLISSVLEFGKAARGTSSPAENIIPAAVGSIARAGIENLFAHRVRAQITKTDPYVTLLAKALAKDVAGLELLAQTDWETVKASYEQSLRTIRRDGRVNRNDLHERYYAMLRLFKSRQSLVNIYAELPTILNAFSRAHNQLINSSDEDRALEEFLVVSSQLRVVIEQLQNN